MPQPMLTTKLFIPRSAARSIPREALVSKWLEGLQSGCRVTLICAPAGYGKTTLMLDLLKASAAVPVWLSLDEGDNDAQRFLAYLCAAFKQVGVPLLGGLDLLLQDAGFQAPEAVMTLLINSAAASKQTLLLVLDDYHLIRQQKVHSLMQFLLAHQAANLHIALLTREDPPLPLSRLRVTEELIEFRAGDLLFGREETSRLLSASLDRPLPPESADRIADCTEGWAAGIKLYALALKGQDHQAIQSYIDKLSGTHAYIIDYLVEEVLSAQPEELRSFLLKTSILSRLDGALCDAVTGQSDGRKKLNEVNRRNLFLIPLDDKREWFRYHALFADSIRAGLSKNEERELCLAAAGHMKSRGLDNEAVAYAFQSGDMEKTIKLVEDSTEEAFRTAQLDTLLSWLAKLPDDLVRENEILCMRRPIACFITGRLQEAVSYMNAMGPDFEKEASPHNRGLFYSMKAMMASAMGQDAEPLAREALRYLEPWDPIARTSTYNTLGRAQYRKGNVNEAAETFHHALDSGMRLGHQFVTTLVMMNYSSCLHALGQHREALSQCEGFIGGMAQRYGLLPPYVGILYVTMAGFLLALGDTEKATLLMTEGEALCQSISYDVAASLKVFDSPPSKSEKVPVPVLDFGEKLSEREIEILRLLCVGLSNGEIAKKLFISTNTTQWHISHLYGKLGVKSRTQAVAKGRELGLIH
jgi:LuxR family transcriptional regulator, maltose regulon positive regulatory protein